MAVIFVRLLDEGVDVWRPVAADVVGDDTFRIVDQFYDTETERWEFEPEDVVRCEQHPMPDGDILAAIHLASE